MLSASVVPQMSKGLTISRSIWITALLLAILLTAVGGIGPAESWKFYIQLPGIFVAVLLMMVTGPFATMFGESGAVFLVVVTILTNALVYAAFVALVLVITKAFKREA
jgi:hypothetical protein